MSGSTIDDWPQDVQSYLRGIEQPDRKQDCAELMALIRKVSGHPPVLWGSTIIGFGRYHYRYASGHEGDTFLVGLSARKNNISVYLAPGVLDDEVWMGRLGKVKAGKGCLYLARLDQVNRDALRELIEYSIDVIRERFGKIEP